LDSLLLGAFFSRLQDDLPALPATAEFDRGDAEFVANHVAQDFAKFVCVHVE
jgi:hypothetical protein